MAGVIEPPFHPIIYVRGYAGTESAVEEAVATPYMGFNEGSTRIRQRWDGAPHRHIFESPLVRLMKDYGYRDAFGDGAEITARGELPSRSVLVYRYYDHASADGGAAPRAEIETYGKGLSDLILTLRDRVCGRDGPQRDAFRVYLVAHSMGGLICRCFLQNRAVGDPEAKRLVDKVFTYATPHNGIDLSVIGNVPGFFSINNADTFNRARMAEYLDLEAGSVRVDDLAGRFDPERFFCLVGTNERDYRQAAGLARRLVGPSSDGLVRIENATVRGAPRGFVHRSHTGHYGIVNSEEGYQNMVRFLFGDVRVDGVLRVGALTLPPAVQRHMEAGRRVRASYHFETVVRCRGTAWDQHRRTTGEQSAVFRTYAELFETAQVRHPHLFSAFLSSVARVKPRRPSLGFSVDLGVLVPQYEIDGAFWADDHHDGGYLFRDKINVELTPPADGRAPHGWSLRYGLDSASPNRASRAAPPPKAGPDGSEIFTVPVTQRTRPGIDAELDLHVRPWNV